MQVNTLQHEQSAVAYTHFAKITHEDLTETTNNTAQVLELFDVKLGSVVQRVDFYLKTPFEDASDAAFNDVAATAGDGGSATRYMSSTQLNVNGTEILAKAGTNTAGHAYVTDDTVDVTFNSMTGKALNDIDAGELWVFAKISELADLG